VKQKTITVNDKMQRGYRYARTAPVGRSFDPDFRPTTDGRFRPTHHVRCVTSGYIVYIF
jgi:hypothetical protein